jgi:hypothetical protein
MIRLPVVAAALLASLSACRSDPPAPRRNPSPSTQTPARPSATADGATATADASVDPISLQPGVGIGPVAIGMSREQLGALGLPSTVNESQETATYGPYRVGFDNGTVAWVETSVRDAPRGFNMYGVRVPPGTTTLEAVTRLVPQCGAVEVAEGGNRATCQDGKLMVLQGSAPGSPVTFRVARPMPTPPAPNARPR